MEQISPFIRVLSRRKDENIRKIERKLGESEGSGGGGGTKSGHGVAQLDQSLGPGRHFSEFRWVLFGRFGLGEGGGIPVWGVVDPRCTQARACWSTGEPQTWHIKTPEPAPQIAPGITVASRTNSWFGSRVRSSIHPIISCSLVVRGGVRFTRTPESRGSPLFFWCTRQRKSSSTI